MEHQVIATDNHSEQVFQQMGEMQNRMNAAIAGQQAAKAELDSVQAVSA